MIEVTRNSIYDLSLRSCPEAYHSTLTGNVLAISIFKAIDSDIGRENIGRNMKHIHDRNILI